MYLNVFLYVFSLGACSVLGVVVSPLMYLSATSRLNINWVVARSFHHLTGALIGLRFKVEGNEKFEKARPAVLVGNHQTGVDIMYLGKVFPKQASIMAKQELKYAPFLGQFSELVKCTSGRGQGRGLMLCCAVYLSGAVFIDRKNRHDAVKAFDQVSKAMKEKDVRIRQ